MKYRFYPLILFLWLSSGVMSLGEEFDIERLDPNMTLLKADSEGVAWFDPRITPFRLTGFPWVENEKVYRRLPKEPKWEIRKPVDSLAWNTAGGQIHFQTDSPRVLLRVKLAFASGMYHMPATGQSGFDLYLGKPGSKTYVSTSRFSAKATEYEVELLSVREKENRHVTLNFPLYNGVKSVEVGVEAGSYIKEPLPFDSDGRVVIYGTSITQGGCASRPGMAYSNILSRRMNYEFVNLGFSGNGKGEPALAKLINQIDNKRILILDYEANVHDDIKKTLENFIDEIRVSSPEMPILVISKIRYAAEVNHPSSMEKLVARAEWQKSLVQRKREAGDKNLFFLDGGTLLGENADECTVDGVHPTDLGFLRMAEGIEPVLREILEN